MTVIAQAYFNELFVSRFPPSYEDGDPLSKSALAFRFDADSIARKDALEQVFWHMNKDARLNGAYERSLSVADVVVLKFEDGSREAYAVAMTGFDRLPEIPEEVGV